MNIEGKPGPGPARVGYLGPESNKLKEIQLPERELQGLQSADVYFGGPDPDARGGYRDELLLKLEPYLAFGFLGKDSDIVTRKVESARHAAGVVPGKTNLALKKEALVFGMLDCQDVGDTYYVCRQGAKDLEYYAITIESGTVTGGPYDIYVTDAMDWIAFKDQLPAM